MLLNIGIAFLVVALGVALGVLFWALVLFQNWPLWYIAPLLVGTLLLIVFGRWTVRRLHAWQLRRRLKGERSKAQHDTVANVDRDWVAGLRNCTGRAWERCIRPCMRCHGFCCWVKALVARMAY